MKEVGTRVLSEKSSFSSVKGVGSSHPGDCSGSNAYSQVRKNVSVIQLKRLGWLIVSQLRWWENLRVM